MGLKFTPLPMGSVPVPSLLSLFGSWLRHMSHPDCIGTKPKEAPTQVLMRLKEWE